MHKKLFALTAVAAAILIPASAAAQSSVTLFGVVETGIQHLTHVNAAGASATSLASGNYAASRWGMLGTEDLGGGYKALFRLEAGFNADDGSNASPASFFNRYSQVSLAAPWGTITTGRTGSVKFDKTALYDPLLFSNYSNISLGQMPPAYLKVNNAIKYQSPSFSNFNVELMYGLGQEAAGNTKAGRYLGAGLEYVAGALSARITHESLNGNTGTPDQSGLVDRRTSVAAAYKTGAWQVFGDYTRVTGNLHVTPGGHIVTAAVGWQATPAARFVLEPVWYKQDGGSGASTLVSALAEYSLSKKTSLFLAAARVNNKNGNRFGVVYPTQLAAPNMSQTGVTLGVAHRF